MLTFLVARKKAIIALIGAIATWAPLALADGHVTLMEWQALVIAMLGVLGVHEVANVPPSTPLGLPTPQTALALAEVLGRSRSAERPPPAPAAASLYYPAPIPPGV